MESHNPSLTMSLPKSAVSVNKKRRHSAPGHKRPRDLLQEKRNTLQTGTWALDESAICEHFGQVAYEKRWFLEGLISLAKAQPNFNVAWELLQETYKSRRAGEALPAGDPKRWPWSRQDVTHAIDVAITQATSTKTLSDTVSKRQNFGSSQSDLTNQRDSKAGIASEASTPSVPNASTSYDSNDATFVPQSRASAASASVAPTSEMGSSQAEVRRLSSSNTNQVTLTNTVFGIKNKNRRKIACRIIKTLKTKLMDDLRSGSFEVPVGQSLNDFVNGSGLKHGLAVEHAIYLEHWGPGTKPSPQCEAIVRMILEGISWNTRLRHQILTEDVSPMQLCRRFGGYVMSGFGEESISQKETDGDGSDDSCGDGSGDGTSSSPQVNHMTAKSSNEIQGKKMLHPKDPSKTSQGKKNQSAKTALFREPSIGRFITTRGKKRTRSSESLNLESQDDNNNNNNNNNNTPSTKAREDTNSKRLHPLPSTSTPKPNPSHPSISTLYLSTTPLLPSNSPPGHPHLIDLTTLTTLNPNAITGLHIADMIATTLYNHHPTTLTRFLDMSHSFTFHIIEPPNSENHDFLIVRTAHTVTCGFVDENKEWSVKHRYGFGARAEGGVGGKWTPLWLEEYQAPGGDEQVLEKIVVDDVAAVMVAGEAMAFALLEAKVWVMGEGARVHVRNSAAWRS